MIRTNQHYAKLHASYLFSEISRRVAEFEEAHPEANVIKMGIGDVTKGLPAASIEAFHTAVDEMARDETFRGYGPDQGYDFLREAAVRVEFHPRGTEITADDIFISDGAKCDTGNIQELFSPDATVAVQDPVYPVYVDTNVMAGRTGAYVDGRYEGLVYLESNKENDFLPSPPSEPVDLIYLCSPNNPTGTVATRDKLKAWVEYARKNRALILFDAAYAVFIRDDELPHTIYEIPGAEEVAIEFRSFSKTAGFTGTRCAYTVVPERCRAFSPEGEEVLVRELWMRRQTTKFNGVSYPVQRAAAAVYSEQGQDQVTALSSYYLENASIIRSSLTKSGYEVTGGVHSPYIWVYTGTDSWSFFDSLLQGAHLVCTPGSGFGRCGEGYVRFSAFNDRDNVREGMERFEAMK